MNYTFLIPAFKAKYIRDTLQSIQGQSYTNYKVLISDDCSLENIRSSCESFLSDFRFLYRRNIENIGGKNLVKHWNLLVDMCETEYLILASDDDIYDSCFLEKIDKLVRKYPECDIFRARVRRVDENCNIIRRDACYEEYVSQIEYIAQRYYTNSVQCISNYVFRTKALKRKGGFIDFPLAWYSDVATTVMMAEHGLVNTRDLLFSFRISSENISTVKQQSPTVHKKKLEAALMFDQWLVNLLNKLTWPQSKEYELIKSFIESHHRKDIYYNISCYRDALSLKELWKLAKKYRSLGYIDNKYLFFKLIQKKLLDYKG